MYDDNPKVSVVILVHNEEKYIEKCLRSLMKQSSKADEIIIVNNNSTDNSVKIAQQFPVRIIHENKQGITYARNKGFNEAQYNIVARTDADTIVPSNWIKRIKKAFSDEQVVAISGPAYFYDLPNIVQRTKRSQTASLQLIKSYNSIVKQILKHDSLYGPNLALRKDSWNLIKNTICNEDKKIHEDIDLAIHLAPLGKIKFIPSLVVGTSVRRWKHLDSYPEYLYRGLKSIQRHRQLMLTARNKQLVKKVIKKAFFFDQIPQDYK